MTTDEMRIAIGISMGRKPRDYYCPNCKRIPDLETITSGGYHNECGHRIEFDCPPLTLDWMQEVKRGLFADADMETKKRYMQHIEDIFVQRKPDSYFWDILIDLKAEEDCEAVLRTLNKWPKQKEDGDE